MVLTSNYVSEIHQLRYSITIPPQQLKSVTHQIVPPDILQQIENHVSRDVKTESTLDVDTKWAWVYQAFTYGAVDHQLCIEITTRRGLASIPTAYRVEGDSVIERVLTYHEKSQIKQHIKAMLDR